VQKFREWISNHPLGVGLVFVLLAGYAFGEAKMALEGNQAKAAFEQFCNDQGYPPAKGIKILNEFKATPEARALKKISNRQLNKLEKKYNDGKTAE